MWPSSTAAHCNGGDSVKITNLERPHESRKPPTCTVPVQADLRHLLKIARRLRVTVTTSHSCCSFWEGCIGPRESRALSAF